MSSSSSSIQSDTAFIGHPRGLAWLSAAEFFERFAYYGIVPLLTLFMTQWLFTPAHVGHVIGLDGLRAIFGWFTHGTLTPMSIASPINGVFQGAVYLTPLAGGALADRFIGRTNAVTLGAILIAAGGFLLAVDQTFLIGLLVLIFGIGCFKGNIASQVGDLYAIEDARRADGFQIYFLGIQFAAIGAPIICGYLARDINPHLGFVGATIGMLASLVIYRAGRKTFPPEPVRVKADHIERPPLTVRDRKAVVLLVALLPVLAVAAIGNQQITNAYLVWGQRVFQTTIFGFDFPIAALVSLDAAVSAVLMIGIIAFWRWYGRHWQEPDEITKIVIGVAISATGPLVLAGCAAVATATHQPVSLTWALGFHILNDIGFSNVFPVGLALYSRAAPKGMGGTMIAVYYIHLFLGNTLMGLVGAQLGKMPDTTFWLLHVGLIAAAAVILLVVRFAFAHLVAPTKADI
jgi:proton-dependent oligopeptide transporter, POT family